MIRLACMYVLRPVGIIAFALSLWVLLSALDERDEFNGILLHATSQHESEQKETFTDSSHMVEQANFHESG